MIEFQLRDIILSLYSTLDTENEIVNTRSIYLFNIKENINRWVIGDNINFSLFISVPNEVSIENLKQFMFYSYWIKTYGSFNSWKEDEDPEKGYYENEVNNENMSPNTKSFLSLMDCYNRTSLDEYNKKQFEEMKKRRNNEEDDEEDEEEDEEDEEVNYENIKFIKDVEQLPSPSIYREHLVNETQYKLTFNNHVILSYFIIKFLTQLINIKTTRSNGVKIPIKIQVLNFHRQCDLLPIRINYASLLTNVKELDSYIENQIVLIKEEVKDLKRKRNMGNLKQSDVVTKQSYKLKFNGQIGQTYHGLLQPGYYTSYDDKLGANASHKSIFNHAKNLDTNLLISKLNSSLSYQSLYVDLMSFNENPKNHIIFHIVDMNICNIIQYRPLENVNHEYGDELLEKTTLLNSNKKIKSIHYDLEKEKKTDNHIKSSVTKLNLKNTKRQTSILSFLA
jgi:hypothetical protein